MMQFAVYCIFGVGTITMLLFGIGVVCAYIGDWRLK